MLLSLRIENFALIDCLDLEFGPSLNVFTGETGAGKSIILDAIDAVLGGKVDRRVIRTGAARAILEATFELDKAAALWLGEQEIEPIDGNLAVCSREIMASSGTLRTRSRLNGILVNRPLMEQLRDRLVEITAQGQTVQLGLETLQREWLDLYGGKTILQGRSNVTAAWLVASEAKTALNRRRQSEQQRLQRLDLLEYQVRELGQAHIEDATEMENLEQESIRLSHVVELQQQSYQVHQALYQNDTDAASAADLLSKAEATLSDMAVYDVQLQPILEMVSDALAQATEASRQISSYGEQLEADPQRLEEVEERIQELKQICRKYGPLKEAIAYYQTIQNELNELLAGGESMEALELAYQASMEQLKDACSHLSALRRETALKLEAALVAELKPLAMEKVQFQVEIAAVTPTANGADRIAFCFSPNPGEPLQPLGAIASGGEMSRFLLAIKACFSQIEGASTLVFDEIDAGVSGRVAGAIAKKLHQLSEKHQVLCVTHQPLIAAMADCHFRVNKQTIGSETGTKEDLANPESSERTVVRVVALNSQQRREELAQLASGRSETEAIAFAESLLAQAASLRQIHAQKTEVDRNYC
ncbi:MAG: DNA repair protein RecN [Oscillatoriales cyanobacterium]|uniref:DNA repair protein RecN n=1 Tax=Microcoleus anatoxicus PTRS2 TaxID=2705321 RepID=A0ABU8YII7_9CYAN|nr:MAG: DNA repair protein RecN [Oscillatoriales cyanobacterium]TAD98278.1 MAG: DNA repair protein RecN [Oscillatoriales cyanobacterium]TAE06082.1 MAG: DNA repair protein RecN [Oscillatoriales cyanobacterium]TAF05429.1 MAG: DNA repair protein RecN [Oscillatoriales cyanobacterium]TAF38306.1 MAG: DNA repair protein RecN [Oscillatoriales cyanobacterium]